MRVLLGKSNLATVTVSISAKTLIITGLNGNDFSISDLVRVYSETASLLVPLQNNIVGVGNVINNDGTETTVYTFTTIPAGIANTDTFDVYINAPMALATYYLTQYQASKV